MGSGSPITYQELKSRILNGTILPGTALVEREIAEQLGVSRVPVREAFQRLVYEGLLVNSHGKELVTRTYNEQQILDLYVFRETLDGLATRLFTSRAEEMEIQYLRMVFREMEDAMNRYEHAYWQEKDIEFHQTIARGARNDRLFRTIDGLYQECFYLMRTYRATNTDTLEARPPHLDAVLEEHRAIVEAIIAGEPKQAEAAACRSVRQATERMISGFIGRNRRPST